MDLGLVVVHSLADLLVALRGDEHLDAGLVHVVDVGPVSLDLRVLDAAGQTVDGPRSPATHHQGATYHHTSIVASQLSDCSFAESETRTRPDLTGPSDQTGPSGLIMSDDVKTACLVRQD